MPPDLCSLPWLPELATGFKEELAHALESEDVGLKLQKLANHRLSSAQAVKLGKHVSKKLDAKIDLRPLTEFSLGILSNATSNIIAEELPASAARHGIALSVIKSDYGQIFQQTIDPQSPINKCSPNAVLLALDYHWLIPDLSSSEIDADVELNNSISNVSDLISNIRECTNASCIVQTIAVPPVSLFGNFDRMVANSLRSRIERFNYELVKLIESTNSYLFDVASIAERVGSDNWFNPVQWHAYKLPFSSEYNSVYADTLGRLLGAIRGHSKKCLVLDLDNTLWGGAIGDEGLDGIILGQGSAAGEAFVEIQKLALSLKDRGIVLAVCSKNNEDTARQPFRKHPEMVLREEDIAVFQANWVDKASNLEAIAQSLNIGIDALVLLDDNPAERNQVRAALPGVGVPELPTDPSWYPWFLTSAGYFETISFTVDDKLRADSYSANARRTEVKSRSRSLGDYLASLDMHMNASCFVDSDLQRITQLINKTNQFNLTTARMTQDEVIAVQKDNKYQTFQFRLNDSFGDMGIIAVVIASCDGTEWNIDSWLMSCRVLGRKVEQGILSCIVAKARAAGISKIRSSYIPTSKNSMVKDHYDKLGFHLEKEQSDGCRYYEATVADINIDEIPISMHFPSDTSHLCNSIEDVPELGLPKKVA